MVMGRGGMDERHTGAFEAGGYTEMARYNRWVNGRLYEVCAGLSDAERKCDLKAFFQSVHGTLNHLLLTDRLWLGRLTETPCAATSLREELYSDFDALRAARGELDEAIIHCVAALPALRLRGELRFASVAQRREVVLPVRTVLLHWFNHQTHHRGQVTVLLQQLGCDYGDIDLPMMPPA